MSTGTLGKLRLGDVRGPRDALEMHLAGDAGEQWLRELNRFVQKRPTWEDRRHIAINCSAQPKQHSFGFVRQHREHGMWRWDHGRVELRQIPQQQDKLNLPTIRDLFQAVRDARPANACVAEYLFDYPDLIPENYKGKHILFMGTIFSDGSLDVSPQNARVRGLQWAKKRNREEWDWFGKMGWLDRIAGPDVYALVIKFD